MTAKKDMTAMRFGRLLVIEEAGRIGKDVLWKCACDCGAEHAVRGHVLRSGQSRSCGCLKAEMSVERFTTHGMKGTDTYQVWCNMIQRCRPGHAAAQWYFDRGISVCERWRNDFAAFLADVGEKPPGKSIDRIDNDRGYEPGNCRWATRSEQNKNRRPFARRSHADRI